MLQQRRDDEDLHRKYFSCQSRRHAPESFHHDKTGIGLSRQGIVFYATRETVVANKTIVGARLLSSMINYPRGELSHSLFLRVLCRGRKLFV